MGPQGPTGAQGPPATSIPFQQIVLGSALGVNYNQVGDTPIPIASGITRYAIHRIVTCNNVGGADAYNGSLRNAPGGQGDDLAHYAYNTDGMFGLEAEAPGLTPIQTVSTLYYRIGTRENAPATGDLYVMGFDLTDFETVSRAKPQAKPAPQSRPTPQARAAAKPQPRPASRRR